MKPEQRMRVTWGRVLGGLLLGTIVMAGCGGGDDGGDDQPDAGGGGGAVLKRASKSGTIAITGDDKFVAMVNPEDDSLSIFDATTLARTAKVNTGDEPSAVVIHPDDATAFVANRAAATVVKITGLTGANPDVSEPVSVGSEPVGLALSPTGKYLYVAEFAEGRVLVLDTATMQEFGKIEAPLNPRALAVTNDGDTDDSDELLVVPEFFGEATASAEAT